MTRRHEILRREMKDKVVTTAMIIETIEPDPEGRLIISPALMKKLKDELLALNTHIKLFGK